MYANVLTGTAAAQAKIPVILETDKEAIKAAIKTCNSQTMSQARVAIIKDTLHLGEIYISESMWDEARGNPRIAFIGEPTEIQFDGQGNVILCA
jgi:hypothetical protein